MVRLSKWFHRISTGLVALIALVVFLAFTATVLPNQAQQAAEFSNGADSPDSSFFYSSSDLYASAEAFGETGRTAYVRARWTFDVAWPLVYTAFLVTAISWVFKKAIPLDSKFQLLNLIPVLGMKFDFLENTAASIVMARFPQASPVAAFLAPIFTPVKWLFVNGSFAVLLVGLILLARKMLRKTEQ